MDETSFIPVDLFELVKAMICVDGSWMFLASSPPKEKDHWFTLLRQSISNIYEDYPLERVCKMCQLEKEMDEWQNCTHQVIKGGLNKPTKRRREISELNTDKELDALENLGVVKEDDNSAFEERHIKRWFERKEMIHSLEGLTRLLISFDPNAGGSDDTGAAVMAMIRGIQTLLWIDYQNTLKATDYSRFIMSTIYAVSKYIRGDNDYEIIIAMESNSRFDGDNLRVALERETAPEFANIYVIIDEQHDHGKGKAGVRLDADRKVQATETFAHLLDANHVKLYAGISTRHPKKIAHVLTQLQSQATRFRGDNQRASRKGHGNKFLKKTHTGKDGKHNDDLMRAILQASYWIIRFYQNRLYAPQRITAGIKREINYNDDSYLVE